MKNENLPDIYLCPFCRHTKLKLTCKRAGTYNREGDSYQVICPKCHARGPLFTYKYEGAGPFYRADPAEVEKVKRRAIEAWNNFDF